MSQAVAIKPTEQRRASLLEVMATKYHMDPQTFANTVRKTAMPSNATNEEFAAFMMVAKEYNLNPILKEIHAFPKKGGGIQPIVSIDGWISLVNQHPQCDGYSFKWENDSKGEPISCECTMYRKDRTHPVIVEEYLAECYRATDPWKMKHRMLRHKALMQAARYAFGFSGIVDQDEADAIASMRDITPPPRPQMADFASTAPAEAAHNSGHNSGQQTGTSEPGHDPATGEVHDDDPADAPGPADAYKLGAEARDKGKALKAVPPEFRGQGDEALADAWSGGWRDRDDELAKAAKK